MRSYIITLVYSTKFEFVGPFSTDLEATIYAQTHYKNQKWVVSVVEPPKQAVPWQALS